MALAATGTNSFLLAHTGHDHGTAATPGENPAPDPQEATAGSPPIPAPAVSETVTHPPGEPPAVADQASMAGTLGGEFLFALILAGPLVLRQLRRQL